MAGPEPDEHSGEWWPTRRQQQDGAVDLGTGQLSGVFCAGTVSTCACGVTPVSAREQKIMRIEDTRFGARSLRWRRC